MPANSSSVFTHDERTWPWVVVTFPPVQLSDAEFERELKTITAYYERGQPFGIVIDAGHAPIPSAARRRTVADAVDRDVQRYPGLLIGVAVVLLSPSARAAIKAIIWLRRSAEPPLTAVPTVAAGLAWLREKTRTRLSADSR